MVGYVKNRPASAANAAALKRQTTSKALKIFFIDSSSHVGRIRLDGIPPDYVFQPAKSSRTGRGQTRPHLQIAPSLRPTRRNLSRAKAIWSGEWAALIWTRMRDLPTGTTG